MEDEGVEVGVPVMLDKPDKLGLKLKTATKPLSASASHASALSAEDLSGDEEEEVPPLKMSKQQSTFVKPSANFLHPQSNRNNLLKMHKMASAK